MKKHILLLILLLSATTIFSQSKITKSPITGLGEFQFGMLTEGMLEALKHHRTNDTEVSYSDDYLTITKLELCGYIFDMSLFKFDKDGLYDISFVLNIDKNDTKIFEELQSILEGDYGGQIVMDTKEMDMGNMRMGWLDENNHILMLSKSFSKESSQSRIMIVAARSY